MRKSVLKFLRKPVVLQTFLLLCLAGAITRYGFGCNGWDPRRPLERKNPEVDRALEMIDAGAYENAEEALRDYLEIKKCQPKQKKSSKDPDVDIGIPIDLRTKADGTFDLGLVLFDLGEKYGKRFGDENVKEEGEEEEVPDPEMFEKRELQAKCGLIVALAIANDTGIATELRARAYYLAGNLEFLRSRYADAIKQYDQSLRLIPGLAADAGVDGIGRDASWNRAVALRRLEQQQEEDGGGPDAGEDAEEPQQDEADAPEQPDGEEDADGSPDAPDGEEDGGEDGDDGGNGEDPGDAGEGDAGEDGEPTDNTDGGEDGGPDGDDPNGSQGEPDAGEPQPVQPDPQGDPQVEPDGEGNQDGAGDDLDEYDKAPSYQGEEAKRRPERPRLEDK